MDTDRNNPFDASDLTADISGRKKFPPSCVSFVVVSFVSGVCSGFSAIYKPLGAFVPGLMFSVALVAATRCFTRIKLIPSVGFIIFGCVALLAAGISTLAVSGRFLNGWLDYVLSLCAGSVIGATLLAIGYVFTFQVESPKRFVFGVFSVAVVMGAVIGTGLGCISNNLANAPSIVHFFTFVIWQTVVGGAFGWFRVRARATEPPTFR